MTHTNVDLMAEIRQATQCLLCEDSEMDKTTDSIHFTTFQLFDTIILQNRESGLTAPITIPYQGHYKPGMKLRFDYIQSNKPGLVCYAIE